MREIDPPWFGPKFSVTKIIRVILVKNSKVDKDYVINDISETRAFTGSIFGVDGREYLSPTFGSR